MLLAGSEATPPERDTVARVAPSTEKVTLPAGVPAEPLTVAFNVTDCPTLRVLGVAVNSVVEDFLAAATVSVAKPETVPPQVSA